MMPGALLCWGGGLRLALVAPRQGLGVSGGKVLAACDLGQSFPSLTLRLLFVKTQLLEWVLRKAFSSFLYSFILCFVPNMYRINVYAVFSLHMTIIKYTLAILYILQRARIRWKARERKQSQPLHFPSIWLWGSKLEFPPRPALATAQAQWRSAVSREPLSGPGPQGKRRSSLPWLQR